MAYLAALAAFDFFSYDCEAIAEHVASVAMYIEKRHAVGRPLEAPHLIRATTLRAAGARGDLTDAGVLKQTLDIFQGGGVSSPFFHQQTHFAGTH